MTRDEIIAVLRTAYNQDVSKLTPDFEKMTDYMIRIGIVVVDPPKPVPNTKEQNIAFRKDWDARVDAGKDSVDPLKMYEVGAGETLRQYEHRDFEAQKPGWRGPDIKAMWVDEAHDFTAQEMPVVQPEEMRRQMLERGETA